MPHVMSATRPPSSSRAPVRTTCTSSREIGVLASTNSTPANATLAQKVCPPICSALVSVAPRPIYLSPHFLPGFPVDPRSPSTPSRLLFPTNSVRCMMYPVSIPSLPTCEHFVLRESKHQRNQKNPLHQQTRTPVWLQPVGNPPLDLLSRFEACSESCFPHLPISTLFAISHWSQNSPVLPSFRLQASARPGHPFS